MSEEEHFLFQPLPTSEFWVHNRQQYLLRLSERKQQGKIRQSLLLRDDGLNSSVTFTNDWLPLKESAISSISVFASSAPPILVSTFKDSSFLPALYNHRGLSGMKNKPTKNSTEGIIPVANIHLQLFSTSCNQ